MYALKNNQIIEIDTTAQSGVKKIIKTGNTGNNITYILTGSQFEQEKRQSFVLGYLTCLQEYNSSSTDPQKLEVLIMEKKLDSALAIMDSIDRKISVLDKKYDDKIESIGKDIHDIRISLDRIEQSKKEKENFWNSFKAPLITGLAIVVAQFILGKLT